MTFKITVRKEKLIHYSNIWKYYELLERMKSLEKEINLKKAASCCMLLSGYWITECGIVKDKDKVTLILN